MQSGEDIFADLLSTLEPDSVKHEPQLEDQVPMKQTQYQNVNEADSESIPVPRSGSPIDITSPTLPSPPPPPPPSLTKEDIQSLITETMKETLYTSLRGLNNVLKTSLMNIHQKLNNVESMCKKLDVEVMVLKTDHGQGKTEMEQNLNKLEDSIKQVSLGVQRMLEKQDLVDAHVLLNKYSKDDENQNKVPQNQTEVTPTPPPPPMVVEESKTVKKSKKKKTIQSESSSSSSEDEDSPVVISKKSSQRRAPTESPMPDSRTDSPVQVQPPRSTGLVGTVASNHLAPGSGYTQPAPVQSAYKVQTPGYGAQNAPPMQNIPQVQNAPLAQNVTHAQSVPQIQNAPLAQSVPNAQNIPQLQNAPPAQNIPQLQNAPLAQSVPNAQNIPQLQNAPPAQNIPQLQNAPLAQSVPNAQNVPQLQNAPLAQSVPNAQTVPQVQNAPLAQGVGSGYGGLTSSVTESSRAPPPQPQFQSYTPMLPPPLPQYQQPRPSQTNLPYSGYPSLPNAPGVQPATPVMQNYAPSATPVSFANPVAARQSVSSAGSGTMNTQMRSLDQVIDDVVSMGFDRTRVNSVVTDLLNHDNTQRLDMNMVLDRLTNVKYSC